VDEADRYVQLEQGFERLSRHRSRNDVPADDDVIDSRVVDVSKDGLERREVAVYVVECGDPLGSARHRFSRPHEAVGAAAA
jgi:hypothetical protein